MATPQDEKMESHTLSDIDQLIHAPARLMLMTYLYVVDSADFVFLKRLTNLSWGNLSTHLKRLEEAGYVALDKSFKGKKPHTMVRMTEDGRAAFSQYKSRMQEVLEGPPG